MKTSFVPIARDKLSDVSAAGWRFGLPRSPGWLERCLFDPIVDRYVTDEVRGHMLVDERGEVLAQKCYFYLPCYFRQKDVLCNTGCMMGADPSAGGEFLRLLFANEKSMAKGLLDVVNCISSVKSVEIQKLFYRRSAPAYRSDSYGVGVADISMYPLSVLRRVLAKPPHWLEKAVWACSRPLQWIVDVSWLFAKRPDWSVVRHDSFRDARFADFWNRFLEANDGVISSREPKRLQWFFDESLAAGTISMLAAERAGRIDGYVIVRANLDERWAKTFEIVDVCAVGNDVGTLSALVKAAMRHVGKLGGIKLVFQGCLPNQEKWLDPFFKRRVRSFPTYLYRANDPEIKDAIESGRGWFMGPFDGERCLGGGGYIDL